MKKIDMTDRAAEAWAYYDELLDVRIAEISRKSGVPLEKFIKINPAEFIEKNPHYTFKGFEYQNIKNFIIANKTDDTFLISPLDAVEETVEQVSYKSNNNIVRSIRASKCKIVPCPPQLAQDFFIRNHRQSAPNIRKTAVCFGLVYKDELVAVMLYDIQEGAVRGRNSNYELVRLAISKNSRVHGGASKLQKACEEALREMGVTEIFSYSNATINTGAVYRALGFEEGKVEGGQPHVILRNNTIVRLVSLYPKTTNGELALRGWMKTKLGGNKTWKKSI